MQFLGAQVTSYLIRTGSRSEQTVPSLAVGVGSDHNEHVTEVTYVT